MGRSQWRRESNSRRRLDRSSHGKECVAASRLGKEDVEGDVEDVEEKIREFSIRVWAREGRRVREITLDPR
jgi:hypothetical protein